MEQEQLSYAKNLWLSFDIIANQSIHERRGLEGLVCVLEDRLNLEKSYIKTIDKLAYSLDKVKERNPLFEESIDLIKSSYFVRSQATASLLDGIKNDLITSLRQCLNQQSQSFKSIYDEGRKLEKDLKFASEEAKKNYAEFRQKTRGYEQQSTIMTVYNLLTEFQDEKKKLKQYYKVNQQRKEVTDAEDKYKFSIKENNYHYENYVNKMVPILNTLQNQEEERLQILKATMTKQLIFEVSQVKNIQYDFENISKKLTDINLSSTLQCYIKQNQTDQTNYSKLEVQQINTFIGFSLKRFFQQEYDNILRIQSDKYLVEMITKNITDQSGQPQDDTFSIKADTISKWFYQLINHSQIDDQVFQQFKQDSQEDLYIRRFFTMCLQAKRSKAEFSLTQNGYKNILIVINALLDIVKSIHINYQFQCAQDFEAGTVRQILQISFSLYKELTEQFETVNGEVQTRQKLCYLHNGICWHPIWKSRDFWETCIIESIYEKMWRNEDKTQNLQERIQHEKTHILSILTQVSQNMLLFNFQLGAIIDIMNKFCTFFALSEDLSQDLFRAINNFEKNKRMLDESEAKISKGNKQVQEPQQFQEDEDEPIQKKVLNKVSSFFQETFSK